MFDDEIRKAASRIISLCRAAKLKANTAESCTGGLLAGALTAIPGASDVVDRGFVTYSNEAKSALLGVPKTLIESEGAVSERVARAMATGALEQGATHPQIAIAVTGVAGPGSDSSAKPAGLVHFAVARNGSETVSARREFGDIGRDEVRRAAVAAGLGLLLETLSEESPISV